MVSRYARHPRALTVALAAVLLCASLAAPSPSHAAPTAPIRLRDDRRIADLKTRLAFDEMRMERRERLERAREAREAARRARSGRRPGRTRGEKMRPEVFDEDLASGRLRAGLAAPAAAENVQGPLVNQLVNAKPAYQDSAGQAEQSISMLGPNGLCAWNDGAGFRTGGDTQTAAWTADGGTTWHPVSIPHPAGAPAWFWTSDPVVTVDEKRGTFYYAGLTAPTATGNGIAVARGHFADGGLFAWDGVWTVRSDPASALIFDKEWVVADSSSGNLYLAYTTLSVSGGDSIVFQRSLDSGAHWSAPVPLAYYHAGANTGVQGARPAVGPGGELYVTWQELGTSDLDLIRVLKSVNQGVSFGVTGTVGAEHSNFGSGAPGFNRNRGITFPAIAVDRSAGPHRGRVYVTWNETVNFYDDYIGYLGDRGEIENNNTFYQASPFLADEVLHGRCASSTDVDHWAFNAQQGTTYIFYLDSLSASLKYSLRVFCSDTLARLAYAGDPNNPGRPALVVWTAPTTGIYFLRVFPAGSAGGYRIYTGSDYPSLGDRARDQRDVVVAWSDDGFTWNAPRVVNDDGPWFDNWLPEVAVTQEGFPYVMWYDWGDGLSNCGGSSNIYTTRSLDGGNTWAPNRKVSTQQTAWTTTLSNIAPNHGDYSAISGGSSLVFAWADGRLGDADVWAATIGTAPIGGQLGCLGDSIWARQSTHTVGVNVQNNNHVFDNNYTVQFRATRSWPGLPMSQSVTQPAGTVGQAWFTFNVPDTAATGNLSLSYRMLSATGAAIDSCGFNVYIVPNADAGPGVAGGQFALRAAYPNPASSRLQAGFSLPSSAPAVLELLDLAGRRMARMEVGGLGPGSHVVNLSHEAAGLAPGVYSIRLTQSGRSLSRKVAIVR